MITQALFIEQLCDIQESEFMLAFAVGNILSGVACHDELANFEKRYGRAALDRVGAEIHGSDDLDTALGGVRSAGKNTSSALQVFNAYRDQAAIPAKTKANTNNPSAKTTTPPTAALNRLQAITGQVVPAAEEVPTPPPKALEPPKQAFVPPPNALEQLDRSHGSLGLSLQDRPGGGVQGTVSLTVPIPAPLSFGLTLNAPISFGHRAPESAPVMGRASRAEVQASIAQRARERRFGPSTVGPHGFRN